MFNFCNGIILFTHYQSPDFVVDMDPQITVAQVSFETDDIGMQITMHAYKLSVHYQGMHKENHFPQFHGHQNSPKYIRNHLIYSRYAYKCI